MRDDIIYPDNKPLLVAETIAHINIKRHYGDVTFEGPQFSVIGVIENEIVDEDDVHVDPEDYIKVYDALYPRVDNDMHPNICRLFQKQYAWLVYISLGVDGGVRWALEVILYPLIHQQATETLVRSNENRSLFQASPLTQSPCRQMLQANISLNLSVGTRFLHIPTRAIEIQTCSGNVCIGRLQSQ